MFSVHGKHLAPSGDVFVPQTRQIVERDVFEQFLDFKMYIFGFGLALKAPKIADLGHFRA